MTAGLNESVALDPEQREVVDIEARTRQIVLAGPGTGKTQVVAELIHQLVEEEGLSASEELLVISFSRAAVSAVRRRTATPGAARVTVRTLDSLASRLLDELEDEDPSLRGGFDARVGRATELLKGRGAESLNALAHLIVDEVQDVVGLRAAFLLSVLQALPADAGFTLLGDPMQAVYDFQLDTRHSMTSAQLLDRVRGLWPVHDRQLKGQYRARSVDSAKALSLGGQLLCLATPKLRASLLQEVIAELPDVEDAPELARVTRRWDGSTACLARTNGEALLLAGELRAAGIPAQLQRAAHEPAVDPIVARLFTSQDDAALSRETVRERAVELGHSDAARLPLLLADVVRGQGDAIDPMRIARRLSAGQPPVELQLSPGPTLLVSTIHRAKGLEFDNVALIGAGEWLREDDSELEDAVRAAFVAITRFRDRLVAAPSPHVRQLRRNPWSDRWYIGGPKKWMTFGFEIQGRDTRCPHPVGDDPRAVQAYLATEVRSGDPVELRLDARRSTEADLPVYGVMHNGVLVGRTTEEFGALFARRIGAGETRKVRWPALTGLVVESVETLAGPPQPPATYGGAGLWGLWLSIRLTGMARLEW